MVTRKHTLAWASPPSLPPLPVPYYCFLGLLPKQLTARKPLTQALLCVPFWGTLAEKHPRASFHLDSRCRMPSLPDSPVYAPLASLASGCSPLLLRLPSSSAARVTCPPPKHYVFFDLLCLNGLDATSVSPLEINITLTAPFLKSKTSVPWGLGNG